MRNKTFLFIPVLLFLLAFVFTSEWLIEDNAMTTDNDSLESEWTRIYGANVELFLVVSDTMSVSYYVDYRMSTAAAYLTTAVDSIVTVGTDNEWLAKSVVLRGQGDSAVINKIPGADWIRLRAYLGEVADSGSFYGGLNQY